jgi:hypothetical protein
MAPGAQPAQKLPMVPAKKNKINPPLPQVNGANQTTANTESSSSASSVNDSSHSSSSSSSQQEKRTLNGGAGAIPASAAPRDMTVGNSVIPIMQDPSK